MKIEYSHHLSELVFDAILKINNRKTTFIRFLRSKHIKDSILSQFDPGETKRSFLERLYPKLQNYENGQKAIINMALEISNMDEFPDLYGFEDSQIKISKAKESVAILKKYMDDEIKKIQKKEERDKFIEEQRQIIEKNKLNRKTLSSLEANLSEIAKNIGTQNAGYEFEKWFYELLDFFEVQCRRPYRTKDSRQIDGAVSINGTDYIIELKFTKKPIGSTDIDPIFVKLQTKADNTMALCVSMSGFDKNAKLSATIGRTMLLLLDFNHINILLRGVLTFQEIIERIKRHAAQTGESYLDPSIILQ